MTYPYVNVKMHDSSQQVVQIIRAIIQECCSRQPIQTLFRTAHQSNNSRTLFKAAHQDNNLREVQGPLLLNTVSLMTWFQPKFNMKY